MLQTILSYVKEFKRDSILTPVCMLFEVAMEMIIPLLMASIVDKGVELGDMSHIQKIGAVMLVMAVGFLLRIRLPRFGIKGMMVYIALGIVEIVLLAIL